MLLASRLNNKFPDDERWLRQKINANSEINLNLLLEIKFLAVVSDEKSSQKKQRIARNSNKTQGEPASAILDDAENCASAEQNRTEQKRTEHNTTQHNRRATSPLKLKRRTPKTVLLCVWILKILKPKTENRWIETGIDPSSRFKKSC
jgi:hypothetical protein